MAFQFPDPNTTPEFTAANGVVYAYDNTDGKWVVKSSPFQGDYVKKTGGDTMDGPLSVMGDRAPNADGVESTIKAYNIDSGRNGDLQLRRGGDTKVYISGTGVTIQGNLKMNIEASTLKSSTNTDLMTFNKNGVFYEGAYTAERHITTKQNLDQALLINPNDPTTNKYVDRTGDSMSGDLNITGGKKIEFTDLGPSNTALRLTRNSGEFTRLVELAHGGGTVLGGYEIRVQGNTNYNELRLMGGSNSDTRFFTFKSNGKIDFFTDVNFNTHKITGLADGTDPRDAVNVQQLSSLTGELDFDINVLSSTQKSMRAGLDDLVAPELQIVSEDESYKNTNMYEGAYALFPGKDDYHRHHVDQRFILLMRMYEGSKTKNPDGTDSGKTKETLDSNVFGNDELPNLAIQDLKTGKLFTINASSFSNNDGNGLVKPPMRGCHVISHDDGSLDAYLWIHSPTRTMEVTSGSAFYNNACPLFRVHIPAPEDIDDSSPFVNMLFKWTNIRCDYSLFTYPNQNPYGKVVDDTNKYQYEIQSETFHLKDKFNNKRYLFISYNKQSKDYCTQRLFEATFDPNDPDAGVIVPVGAHPDSTWGGYAAGYPALKKTVDGGVKCFLHGTPVGLTEVYFVSDGAGEKLEMRNYGDYTPEGPKVVDPNGAVNELGHPIIISKGIYDNYYKNDSSAPQWLTEGLWDEKNPFSTKLIYFSGSYGVVSIPTEDLGNKAHEVKLENNYKGDLNSLHIDNGNNQNYIGYLQQSSVKNLQRFATNIIDARSNGSVWFFDYKQGYVNDNNNYYNDTRIFDAGGNKTFYYEFKRGIVEVRPNIPEGTIDIIGHEVGRKRSDNGNEEGNITDFSGEAFCKMYDQFVCVAARGSHSTIQKPRVHIFDPFTKVVSLVSHTQVSASTAIPVTSRALVALSNFGKAEDGNGETMHYVSMLAGANETVNIRKQASTLRTLYGLTGTDVATADDTWTLDAPVAPGTEHDGAQPESEWDFG